MYVSMEQYESSSIVVTAQPQPQPQHNKKVGWDTVNTKKNHPTHHKLKLHERTRIEQYLENKIY